MGDSPFIPKCLACEYDLTGVPEGKCPECGQAFSLVKLRFRHDHPEPKLRDGFSILFLGLQVALAFVPPALPTVLSPGSFRDNRDPAITIAICGVAILWLILDRRRLIAEPRRLVWLIPAIARSIFIVLVSDDKGAIDAALLGGLACLGLVSFAVRAAPRYVLWFTGLYLALILCLLGASMAFDAIDAFARHHTWTSWPDPRRGQIHDQYPLRADEVAVLAGVTTLLGGLGLVVCWRFRKVARNRG